MNEDNVPVADESVDPFEGRNPAVVHIMQFFTYAHLKGDDLQSVSAKVAQLGSGPGHSRFAGADRRVA